MEHYETGEKSKQREELNKLDVCVWAVQAKRQGSGQPNTNLYTSTLYNNNNNTIINAVKSPGRKQQSTVYRSPARLQKHLSGNIRGHAELDVKLWRNMACCHTDGGKLKKTKFSGWLEVFERFAFKIKAGGAETDQALTHSSRLTQADSMPGDICNHTLFQISSGEATWRSRDPSLKLRLPGQGGGCGNTWDRSRGKYSILRVVGDATQRKRRALIVNSFFWTPLSDIPTHLKPRIRE